MNPSNEGQAEFILATWFGDDGFPLEFLTLTKPHPSAAHSDSRLHKARIREEAMLRDTRADVINQCGAKFSHCSPTY